MTSWVLKQLLVYFLYMLFDFYLNALFSLNKNIVFLFAGFIFLLIGIPSAYQGVRGVMSGEMILSLKEWSNEDDKRTGIGARVWGVFYILFSLFFIGIGGTLIATFIFSLLKR